MFNSLKHDIQSIMDRDPAAKNWLEVLLLYSGLHAIIWYRISHKLYVKGHFTLARTVSQWGRFWTGIEIHPGAKIGKGLFIDHGMGVVIGETTEIGDYCTIYQGSTLGGTGKDIGKRHPTLGNHVLIGAGAKVLGPFTVGDHAKIAANAVVLSEVPPNTTVVGVPGRFVEKKDKAEINLFDHIHTPDPVSIELCKMLVRMEHLEKQLEAKKNETV
ncbi:MAG: serine O-acetyltransferase [Hyphomonadaceae bacterium]|nr:serine O-acetyltransferase [Clostridia bacterium]